MAINPIVLPEAKKSGSKSQSADVHITAKLALLRMLEPLAGFVLDSGVSTGEMYALFREAAVRSAAAKQQAACNRINISGISATTGIPRGEISRILKISKEAATQSAPTVKSINQILAAWHQDPKFTDQSGKPADLKVYGRGPTFAALAKKYGRGIPTRAILDELIRTGSVELASEQMIRAKASVAVERGMDAQVIDSFGNRAAELLSTMLSNMRQPDAPKFVACVSDGSIPSTALPLLRREFSHRGANFLTDIQETLFKKAGTPAAKRNAPLSARINVTVFYYEQITEITPPASTSKRRNFKREE